MQPYTKARAITFAAACLGTGVFLLLNLPLPFLMGPLAACLIFAVAGAPLEGMGVVGIAMRTILGIAIGASITPATLSALPGFAPTLVLVPLFVGAIGLVGFPFFHKLLGFDRATSFYAAMPGGLQDMLVFGEEAGGDVRAMSLIHATRVLAIVATAPFVIAWIWEVDLTAAPGQPASAVGWGQIVIMAASGLAGWKIAERVGLFGASILGPMILTAVLSLSGVIHSRPPAEMIWAAQFFIGLAVGSKYTGIAPREIRVDIGAGLGYAVLLTVISLGFLWVAAQLSDADTLDMALSFLPGGQGEMVVVAIIAGADLSFVVTHHLMRLFSVILLAPIIGARLTRD
ncbi:AbrB family transcriptional regulator [Aliiroseovarius sp.]|uniref:AbrB family transcriptional regulator n=1 Tax=Aliiroseovarius sp. TaxID=1872442 RepID=UPI0026068345|nr:AbrB family transcriptional regulator [Aliiroseovarius sp.]